MADINGAYSWAISECAKDNVGYSQSYRNQQTVNGITYYDCSSFINYALLAGGWETPSYAPNNNAFTTVTEPSELIRLGFTEVPSTGEYLPGDIGVSDGHTEMCYVGGSGSGVFMGAHTDDAPLADQVSISNFTMTFPRLFRFGSGGALSSSIYVVSAMAGNFWQESGINPGIWEGLQEESFTSLLHGYGIGQWTNVGDTHGRLYKMAQWVLDNGYEVYDGEGQVRYIIVEDYWTPNQEAGAFPTLSDFLNSDSTDLEFLTHAFNIGWEGIHDDTWDARVEYAQKCFDFISAHYDDESITEWIYGNRFLSEDERLNNAVMLYRALSGSIKPEVKKKKKMSILLYQRWPF